MKIRKMSILSLATSEIDVSFDSGVTSSLVSSSLVGSTLFPRCTQGSHPCLGHHDTWFPGINMFTSWLAIVDDDEDEAEGGPPSAKPPPPPRTHQPPEWSRVNNTVCSFPFCSRSKSYNFRIVGLQGFRVALTVASCQEQRVFLNPGCDRFWVSSLRSLELP